MFENTVILIDWIRESSRHFEKTKQLAKKTRDYYNGDQLDRTIKNILANRGQPEHYENQIAKHHKSIMGHKKDRNVEIKIFSGQVEDKEAAYMLNALLKNIRETTDYNTVIEKTDETLAIEGVGIVEHIIKGTGEKDRFDREHKNIGHNHIPFREMFLDPFANPDNYAETARYTTRCFWIDKEDLYPLGFDEDKIEQLQNDNYLSSYVESDLYFDRNVRERVLLSYTWYRKWDKKAKKEKFYYCFWSNDVILLQGESPYDFKGIPYDIEFFESDFTGEIKFWGLYRHIIPLQDNINYAKLRLQNMLGGNKTYVNRTAIVDEDIGQFNQENSLDNTSILVEDINGIKDVKRQAQIQQLLNVIVDSRNQIAELLNSNKELLGNANNRMSEVGQLRRIKSGLVGLKAFTDKSERLEKKIAHKDIAMIGQYYDTERIVNIIDDDLVDNYLMMNETIENQYGGIDYDLLENGNVVPLAKNKVKIEKYNLIYLAREKEDTQSDERLRLNQELMRTVRENKPELTDFVLPMILKDMGSPDAKKLKDHIEQQQIANQNSPEAQRIKKLEEELTRLEMQHKQSQTNLNNTKAKSMLNKNQIDLQKAFSSATIAQENIRTKQQHNLLTRG